MGEEYSELRLVCEGLEALPSICNQLLTFSADVKVWLFDGDLGAGKTTTIKQLCRDLGSIDDPSSPTFNLINEYLTDGGYPVYHFDFYRIESEEEAFDIGVEEYFDSGYYCFVEWPERIPSLWPDRHIMLKLSVDEAERRVFEIRKYD